MAIIPPEEPVARVQGGATMATSTSSGKRSWAAAGEEDGVGKRCRGDAVDGTEEGRLAWVIDCLHGEESGDSVAPGAEPLLSSEALQQRQEALGNELAAASGIGLAGVQESMEDVSSSGGLVHLENNAVEGSDSDGEEVAADDVTDPDTLLLLGDQLARAAEGDEEMRRLASGDDEEVLASMEDVAEDSVADLGYLWQASDDMLGIPPSPTGDNGTSMGRPGEGPGMVSPDMSCVTADSAPRLTDGSLVIDSDVHVDGPSAADKSRVLESSHFHGYGALPLSMLEPFEVEADEELPVSLHSLLEPVEVTAGQDDTLLHAAASLDGDFFELSNLAYHAPAEVGGGGMYSHGPLSVDI